MKRTGLLLAAGLTATLWIGGARAERGTLPPTPEPLRQFDGSLYGEVEQVRRDADFTGLVLKLSLVETPSAGLAPAQVSGLEGARVAVAAPLGQNGRTLSPEHDRQLRMLRPSDPVRIFAHAEGPEHTLYLRSIESLAGPPAPEAPSPSPIPPPVVLPPAPTESPAPAPDTPSPEELQRLAAELRAMRRELARLQQDVADLRAVTMDLVRR